MRSGAGILRCPDCVKTSRELPEVGLAVGQVTPFLNQHHGACPLWSLFMCGLGRALESIVGILASRGT